MDNFVNHAASGKLRSVVLGIGSYLPKRIVSNADLEKSLETTDEWIVQRTGIRQRHVAAEDEPTRGSVFMRRKPLWPMRGLKPRTSIS